MLFWIALGVLTFGIVWLIIDEFSTCGLAFTTIGVIAVASMLIIIGVNYIGVDGFVASMNERYEMLTYQYDNGFYENDNDVGKFELVAKIQKWNEDLAARKTMQRDFWVGIFIPNIYDQFDFIELEAK